MTCSLCFSLVLYNHSLNDIRPLLFSLSKLADASNYFIRLCVYDGSSSFTNKPSESDIQSLIGDVCLVHQHGLNVGFGSAHNKNFSVCRTNPGDLFIVVNPDISFDPGDLLTLFEWVKKRPDASCIAPLILNPNGRLQPTAKHNPTFLSLLLGRFPFLKFFRCLYKYDFWHRNLQLDYFTDIIACDYLSGCFLIIPSHFYAAVGGFCEKYFLHMEDADLVRRLSSVGLALHNPIGRVIHVWARGSHRSFRQTLCLLKSYYIYSRSWGFALF